MQDIRPVCVDNDIANFLKDIAEETNSTIASVANYYLSLAIKNEERPALSDLQRKQKRGRKRREEVTVLEVAEGLSTTLLSSP